ncbi:hypothetical protein KC725_00705, partial [Candidatus Peregrinibacteria bacterium]|nr:hypothetical protein [Candidatus Peregrinibacteria bacterium]
LCDNCKKPVEKVDDELLEIVKKAISEIHSTDEIDPAMLQTLQFYDAPGCEVCEGIGYKGRIGLYEVMRMNNELRRMILSSASTLDIEKKAMEGGMVTLEQMGIIKALKGETSLNEVYRVAKRMELGDDSKKNEKADEQKPIPDENPEAEKSAPSKKVVAQVQQVTPPAEQPKPASPSIPTPAPAPEENSPQTPPSDTQQQ